MSEDIRALSARALRQAYQSRTLSPVEVTETLLDQIERQDPALNAWCLIDRETTLASAREAEQRYLRDDSQGLLDGIPVAIKDVFLTPMWPTLKGSRTVDPAKTLGKRAPAVAALERHGLSLIHI